MKKEPIQAEKHTPCELCIAESHSRICTSSVCNLYHDEVYAKLGRIPAIFIFKGLFA